MSKFHGLSRRRVLAGAGGVFASTLAGCTSDSESTQDRSGSTDGDSGSGRNEGATTGAAGGDGEGAAWRTTELTDVRTDETFTVQQFEGRPVVLEAFAVWCPVCTRQQQQLGTAVEQMDDLVAISINIDPNEDASQVQEHIQEYQFDWWYTISPPDMTESLVDEFGSVITNPPAAPVVQVCPDGSATLMEGRGVKSASDIGTAFEQC